MLSVHAAYENFPNRSMSMVHFVPVIIVDFAYSVCVCMYAYVHVHVGLVLAVLSHGGLLLASSEINPGSLMSFLIATQTIQRSLTNMSVLFGQLVQGMTAGGRVFEVGMLL